MSLSDFLVFKDEDVIVTPEPLEITLELLTPRVYVDKSESYVYVYFDQRKPGKYSYEGLDCSFFYEPFYVGKGYRRRCLEHLKEAYKNKSYNLKYRIIREIKEITNKDPIIIKYKENLFENDAFNQEIKLIKAIGRIDLKTGSLTNLTGGGDGTIGRICTDEQRKKLRGKHVSEETKQKIREKRKFQIITDETRKKMSISGKGRKHTDETKKKSSISKMGNKNPRYGKIGTFKNKYHTNETKKLISLKNKGHIPWNKNKHISEETKKLISLKNKGRKHTDETKKKISITSKNRTHVVTEQGRKNMRNAFKNRVYKKLCVRCNSIFISKGTQTKYCLKCKELSIDKIKEL